MKLPSSIVRRRGFVLLEVILALALFATVATSMAIALNQLATASLSARRESILLRRLESELAELAHLPRLPMGSTQSTDDASGIFVRREVNRLDLQNQAGDVLEGLYEVRVTASLAGSNRNQPPLVREMETFVIRLGEIPPAGNQPAHPPAPQTGQGTTR